MRDTPDLQEVRLKAYLNIFTKGIEAADSPVRQAVKTALQSLVDAAEPLESVDEVNEFIDLVVAGLVVTDFGT